MGDSRDREHSGKGKISDESRNAPAGSAAPQEGMPPSSHEVGGSDANSAHPHYHHVERNKNQAHQAEGPRHAEAADDAAGAVREDLLDQFYSTLRATYLSAAKETKETRDLHERIRSGLDGERSWRGAYEVEQLLIFIMNEEQLATEVARRIGEAEALDLPFVVRLTGQLGEAQAIINDENQDEEAKARGWRTVRYVLHRLLNDLQWFYKQRIRRRDAAMRLSVRVSALFFTALAYFFALLFAQFFAHNPGGNAATERNSAAVPMQGELPHNNESSMLSGDGS